MNKKISPKELLLALFRRWSGEQEAEIALLPGGGSGRKYFLITASSQTLLGAFNTDKRENLAFLGFTRHFERKGLPVPKIFAEDLDNHVYLLEYLGKETLFSFLSSARGKNGFSGEITEMYKKVISFLPRFQIEAAKGLDYSLCYPRAVFDKQSMMWDLNYFKYYFLKLLQISFHEQELENDFNRFADYLMAAGAEYFMYRDFQSRNILIKEGAPYFIDYQGGRKGALQYDIASLLWDAKADIPPAVREELFDYYLQELAKYIKKINTAKFTQYYRAFVYIRLMQAMGAYGFRGLYERREHFLQSIPYAIRNLRWLLSHFPLPLKLPALQSALEQLANNDSLLTGTSGNEKLLVNLYSFSYKNGIPLDFSGHGGGFVFDCRAIVNPGRMKEYYYLTGHDAAVKKFLKNDPEAEQFYKSTEMLVLQAVKNYMERGFNMLMVCYGCTGGRHRSVYFAERLKKRLSRIRNIQVRMTHREIGNAGNG